MAWTGEYLLRHPIVAFDVDGTLIDYDGKPRHEIVAMLQLYDAAGFSVVVWSGGGIPYAAGVVRELGLADHVVKILPKQRGQHVTICFDDEDVKLAEHNVRVPILCYHNIAMEYCQEHAKQ